MEGEDRGKISVLHVDDDPDFLSIAATNLERKADRISVQTATTAQEGLEHLETSEVDCIIADYEMPDLSGIEFLETVREDHPGLPFILFTGKGSEDVASEAISAGVTDYVQKDHGSDHYALLANRIANAVKRRRASAELAEAKDRYQNFVEFSSDIVMVIDNAGEVTYVSPAVERVLGYDPERPVGEGAFEHLHPDDRERVLELFTRVKNQDTKTTERLEYRFKHKDGSYRWLESIGIDRTDTEIGGFLIHSRDITERKEFEQELEEQRDNLEYLNQVVRHDIRNELQLILGYADTLESRVEAEDKVHLEKIREGAREAVEITKMARDMTEVMRQSDIMCSPVALKPVLEDEAREAHSKYEHAAVTFDGPVPNVEVLANEMLESVFRNLLNNAVQHNDKETPEVTISATRETETMEISIADNGPGIPDELKDKIFEKGYIGADSTGAGLGLYLVESLVEQYGGEVRVEDNEPTGTVFIVELPLAE